MVRPVSMCLLKPVLLTAHVFTETEISRRESLGLNSLTDGEPAGPDYRPPHTSAEIVKSAIIGSPHHKLALSEIRRAMEERFAYYGNPKNVSWRVSSLSLAVFLSCEAVAIWRSTFVTVVVWEQGVLSFSDLPSCPVSPRRLLSIHVHGLL
jgi:hypothetical protein